MLTVILIWLYVIATTYLTGYGFLTVLVNRPSMHSKKGSRGMKQYDFRYKENYMVAGIVLVTVYAQVISIFTGVGLGANLALLLICIFIAFRYRYELFVDILDEMRIISSRGNIYIYLAVFLIMAYGASHGIMHYDSDLYHAQAIHWIEKYGIVRGLGNLHVRLAYNSAAFPLTALYSFSFISGRSYHVMAGFFALLLAWQCVDIKNIVRRGHPVIADFARLVAIYYLFTIYDEMVAPASDYFLSTIVFYIIIRWLDMLVRHEKSYVPYILLTLLGIYAVTIKLSAAPIALLAVVPIYKIFKGKNGQSGVAAGRSKRSGVEQTKHERDDRKERTVAFWLFAGFGFAIVLPFLIRNIIISGWLVYPVTFLDLFNVPWKIPKGLASYDALEIKTFGHGFNDVAAYGHMAFRDWVPLWFRGITGISKVMLILDMISFVVYVLYLLYIAAQGNKKDAGINAERGRTDGAKGAVAHRGSKVFALARRSVLGDADFLMIGATLICCLAFWFLSAPLIRYGVVYVWLTPAVILGRMFILGYNRLGDQVKTILNRAMIFMFMIWLVHKGMNLIGDDIGRFNADYLFTQQDYGIYETREFRMGDETIYYPADGDQIGYYPFPAATHDLTGEVELAGSSLKDGFVNNDTP